MLSRILLPSSTLRLGLATFFPSVRDYQNALLICFTDLQGLQSFHQQILINTSFNETKNSLLEFLVRKAGWHPRLK